MYVKFEIPKIKCIIMDFINNDEITQATIGFPTDYKYKDSVCINKDLYKLKDERGNIIVFVLKEKILDNIYGNDTTTFLFVYNKQKKYIIYTDIVYGIDMISFTKNCINDDYKCVDLHEITNNITNDYINKVQELFDNNTNNFLDNNEAYKKQYEAALKANKEPVLKDIISGRDVNYFLNVDMDRYNKIFTNLSSIEEYIEDPKMIDKITREEFEKECHEKDEFFPQDTPLMRHARVIAKRKICEEYKKNQPYIMKLSLKIGEAIKKGGKTLNITTKNNKTVKVESFFNGYWFATVKGYDDIKIEDIKEITFGRKTLFRSGEEDVINE